MRKAALVLALCLAFFRPAAAAEAVILTDIHFNPLADGSLAEALAAAPAEQWVAILDRGAERMSGYGADTDWKLLRAALAALAARPKPALVLLPGDFLAHNFRAMFDKSLVVHDDTAYRRFVVKTMRFLALQLSATFGDAPLLPALGNNDSDCGDYDVRPGGAFLADTEPIAAAMVGRAASADFARSWTALGDYVAADPASRDTSIVAFSDNFLSPHYRNACGEDGDGNPARATLAWLDQTLAAAARAPHKVILIYHIPPGADAFATARKDACPGTPVPLLAEPYATEFHALLRRYRGTVVEEIAGHLHTAAFRIRRDGGAAFGSVLIAPALSPIFGQNPAFSHLALAPDGTILDATTAYLANLPAAVDGAVPQWLSEASFDREWDASRLDMASLETLYRRIGNSPAARERWIARYGVQGPAKKEITPQNAALYRCSVGNDRVEDVAHCLCDGAR